MRCLKMTCQIHIQKEGDKMIRIGVIFGGESVEHEVSIISAVQAMNKLDEHKYEIVPIYITKDNEWYTGEMLKELETYQDMDLMKKYARNVVLYNSKGHFVLQSKGFFKSVVKEIDIAMPIGHGSITEDGVLQGYLRMVGIPFVGCDVWASAFSQDKVVQKQIWAHSDLPLVDYVWFYDSEYLDNSEEVIKRINKLKYPLIIKPATLGSSVGIVTVKKEEALAKAIEDVMEYDTKILVEEMVDDLTEVNISVLGNYENQQLSVIEQVMSEHDLLTYEDKYINGSKKSGSKGMASTLRKIPADISEKMADEVRTIATTAFKTLGASGVSRIDFLIDSKKKKVYVNEINPCPGSLSFYLWDPLGKDYTTLLDDLVNIGVKDYKKRASKTHSFETNILQGYNFGLKGSKGKLK